MIKSMIDKINAEYDISVIPFEKLTLTSTRDFDLIQSSIRQRLEWTETFELTSRKKSFRKYEGWIKNGEFKFRRILKSGRNSFIPIVSGRIYQDNERVKIDTKIEFQRFTSIFLIVFISFALIMFILNTSSIRSNNSGFSLLLVIVPYIVSVVFFNIESRNLKNDLREIILFIDENSE
jgi:hypothetical protein